jgi:hypothetical protein
MPLSGLVQHAFGRRDLGLSDPVVISTSTISASSSTMRTPIYIYIQVSDFVRMEIDGVGIS